MRRPSPSGQMYSPLTASNEQIGGACAAAVVGVLNSDAAIVAAARRTTMMVNFMLSIAKVG